MKRIVLALFILTLFALAAVALADPGMTWQDIAPGTLAHVHCTTGTVTALPAADNTIVVYCETPALVSPPVALERMR